MSLRKFWIHSSRNWYDALDIRRVIKKISAFLLNVKCVLLYSLHHDAIAEPSSNETVILIMDGVPLFSFIVLSKSLGLLRYMTFLVRIVERAAILKLNTTFLLVGRAGIDNGKDADLRRFVRSGNIVVKPKAKWRGMMVHIESAKAIMVPNVHDASPRVSYHGCRNNILP